MSPLVKTKLQTNFKDFKRFGAFKRLVEQKNVVFNSFVCTLGFFGCREPLKRSFHSRFKLPHSCQKNPIYTRTRQINYYYSVHWSIWRYNIFSFPRKYVVVIPFFSILIINIFYCCRNYQIVHASINFTLSTFNIFLHVYFFNASRTLRLFDISVTEQYAVFLSVLRRKLFIFIVCKRNIILHSAEMLEVGVNNQISEQSKDEWSLNNLTDTTNPKETNHHVIRKFINSAIYVEKPVASTVSNETIPISQKISNEDLLDNNTKRCTCSVDPKTCPCHGNSFFAFIPKETRKSGVSKVSESKTKISSTCLSSSNVADEKEALIKNWIAKKEEEKRKKEMKEKMVLEAKLKEKELLLEQERNNFKKWLTNKKKLEAEAKKKKGREQEEQQLKELEKEKRHLENQLNFQLWVKKKEEVNLGTVSLKKTQKLKVIFREENKKANGDDRRT
jgi:hypothetical protein